MLRVTLEKVPFGDESQKSTIEVIEISNVFGNELVADYQVKLTTPGSDYTKVTRVRGFPREQGAWNLVIEALYALHR